MKIAIVSAYMMESVFPLAKHLAEENQSIHLYAVMPQYNQNVFVVDFTENKQPNGFIKPAILKRQMGEKLVNYISEVDTNFFVFPAGSGKKTFFSDIYYAWQLSQHLIKKKFDIIHLVHSCNRFSLLLLHFLKDQRLVQTLHEVTGHSGDTDSYDIRILKKLIQQNIPVIFHSHTSMDRFIAFKKSIDNLRINKDQYTVIRFGLYETYTHYFPAIKDNGNQKTDSSIPVILHFGRIVPYKGIDILIDAIKIIQQQQPVHLIIAGSGKSYFNLEGVNSYEFINHSLSNEMIVSLIEKCTMVVCPYRSASQSGIPVTVYPFNKPIVASNTGGFKEMIDHNSTGLIVDDISPEAFASAIEQLMSDSALREKMSTNIKEKFRQGEFSWKQIATQTIQFYSQHLQHH